MLNEQMLSQEQRMRYAQIKDKLTQFETMVNQAAENNLESHCTPEKIKTLQKIILIELKEFHDWITQDKQQLISIARHRKANQMSEKELARLYLKDKYDRLNLQKTQRDKYFEEKDKEYEMHINKAKESEKETRDAIEELPEHLTTQKRIQHISIMLLFGFAELLLNISALAKLGDFSIIGDIGNSFVIAIFTSVGAELIGIGIISKGIYRLAGMIGFAASILLLVFIFNLRILDSPHFWVGFINIAVFLFAIAVSLSFHKKYQLSDIQQKDLKTKKFIERQHTKRAKNKALQEKADKRYHKALDQLDRKSLRKQGKIEDTQEHFDILFNQIIIEPEQIPETKENMNLTYSRTVIYLRERTEIVLQVAKANQKK